jgi:hypothetical protein
MFSKIFQRHIKLWQRALIFFGAFVGLVLFWIPLACYHDIDEALSKQTEVFGSQYLVLNKEVSFMNALGAKPKTFTDAEVDSLLAIEGTTKVGKFTANTFKAMAEADFGGGQVVRTELFFESVPDKFMDTRPSGWNWAPEDESVPIVIPTDYLALYNFGFAPGQGLPQISPDIAKLSNFNILISGPKGEQVFAARIAGFSDRINTVLAPQNFLDYCNSHFVGDQLRAPSRVIVETNNAAALEKWMKQNGYETNKESMQSGKTKAIAQQVFLVTMIFAALIVLLSLGSFFQFTDLVVARSDQEIKTMLYLGYKVKTIATKLFLQIMGLVMAAFVFALVAGLITRKIVLSQLKALVAEPTLLPHGEAFLWLFATVVFYLLVSYFNALRQVFKLSKPY